MTHVSQGIQENVETHLTASGDSLSLSLNVSPKLSYETKCEDDNMKIRSWNKQRPPEKRRVLLDPAVTLFPTPHLAHQPHLWFYGVLNLPLDSYFNVQVLILQT